MNGRTDGWTDRRTDIPSNRDARTHLKMGGHFSAIVVGVVVIVVDVVAVSGGGGGGGGGDGGELMSLTAFKRFCFPRKS